MGNWKNIEDVLWMRVKQTKAQLKAKKRLRNAKRTKASRREENEKSNFASFLSQKVFVLPAI